jgi:hypothetical protein
MKRMHAIAAAGTVAFVAVAGCSFELADVSTDPAVRAQTPPEESFDSKIDHNASELFREGRRIFRYDTFGSEQFWGDSLKLHSAIAGEKFGGVGPGISPRQALQLGLKVDVAAVPRTFAEVLKAGKSASTIPRPRSSCCARTP